ncbi:MAG: DNA (cytosine-5-)-methyltransferase [Candidatus Kapaibacterium sp.]|nr:MAG: DNA (cytosine-5-)-methyltransferase [Candidatus Kapabacteria bacterium]
MQFPLRTIDLFAGIGGIRLGFEHFGCRNVFTSEWDADAQATYHANFGEMPDGDITAVQPEDIPAHDILLAGFPCQPFSIIGNMGGFADTRGTLFFNIEEILRVKQPYSFLLENVKQLRTHDNGRTFRTILEHLHELGYTTHHTVLNTLDFGLPHKRERTFIVGFRENIAFSFPKPTGAYKSLTEILETGVDTKLYASEMIVQKRREKIKHEPFFPSVWHENKGGNISILPFSCALRAGGSYNYLLVNGERRPSSREMLRLQGFPDSFKIVVGYSAMRKLTGNSVSVPVIQAIAGEMMRALRERHLGV